MTFTSTQWQSALDLEQRIFQLELSYLLLLPLCLAHVLNLTRQVLQRD